MSQIIFDIKLSMAEECSNCKNNLKGFCSVYNASIKEIVQSATIEDMDKCEGYED